MPKGPLEANRLGLEQGSNMTSTNQTQQGKALSKFGTGYFLDIKYKCPDSASSLTLNIWQFLWLNLPSVKTTCVKPPWHQFETVTNDVFKVKLLAIGIEIYTLLLKICRFHFSFHLLCPSDAGVDVMSH